MKVLRFRLVRVYPEKWRSGHESTKTRRVVGNVSFMQVDPYEKRSSLKGFGKLIRLRKYVDLYQITVILRLK